MLGRRCLETLIGRRGHSQLLEDVLQFGALRQVLVQIEKVLELELVDGQHVQLAGRQAGDVERLLDAPPVVLVGGEQFDDAEWVWEVKGSGEHYYIWSAVLAHNIYIYIYVVCHGIKGLRNPKCQISVCSRVSFDVAAPEEKVLALNDIIIGR